MNRANSTVAVVYTYTSSSASIATVTAAGVVTAVAPGTTTITVSAAGTGTGFAAATMTTAVTITVSDRAAGTFTYSANLIQASVQVSGLPAGVTTILTFTQVGQAPVTSTALTGANIVNLPSIGTWAISASSSVTSNSLVYTPSGATTVAAAAGSGAVAAAGTIAYANTTYYTTVTTTIPAGSGVVPNITVTPTSGTSTASITTVGTANRTFGTTAPGSTVFLANPVAVAGITYGVGTPSVTLTPTTSTSTPTTASFAYDVAKTTVQFSGANLTDLTGYTVPVILVGPAGEQVVSAAGAVSATATAAQSLVIAGSYSVKAIPSITIGSSTYQFASAFVAATYGSTSAIVVTVTRTNSGNAINGVMTTSASANTGAPWTDATIATTRSVTFGSLIGLTGPAATVTYTCSSSDATLISTVTTIANGVPTCTMTGLNSVATSTPVTITFTATGGGTSLNSNVISSTIVINRTP